MTRAWRLCREAYQALDGEGARLYGGRWNSRGHAMVYLASTLSLAALEYLVHVDPEDVPDDLVAMAIVLPSTSTIDAWNVSDLPADWRQATAPLSCQERGDAWVTGARSLALVVPSVLVPEETNLLLNPKHPLMGQVQVDHVRRFVYDPRLIG